MTGTLYTYDYLSFIFQLKVDFILPSTYKVMILGVGHFRNTHTYVILTRVQISYVLNGEFT